MTCEARATDDDVVEDVTARIRAVIAGASLAHGVEHEMFARSTGPRHSPAAMTPT
jgi:metal-dependent amidase/aminoacylase/carboxypeptidase family protein